MRTNLAAVAAYTIGAVEGLAGAVMRPAPPFFDMRPSWQRARWNPNRSKYSPHQSERECARRLRNIAKHGAPG